MRITTVLPLLATLALLGTAACEADYEADRESGDVPAPATEWEEPLGPMPPDTIPWDTLEQQPADTV